MSAALIPDMITVYLYEVRKAYPASSQQQRTITIATNGVEGSICIPPGAENRGPVDHTRYTS